MPGDLSENALSVLAILNLVDLIMYGRRGDAGGVIDILPISAVIATRNRAIVFDRTLRSLRTQSGLPQELIVVDASIDEETRRVVARYSAQVKDKGCRVIWQPAAARGAAVQRNQGVALATQRLVCLVDDDILFEEHCLVRLFRALDSDPGLGGVSALIVNQHFSPPGRVSRIMYRLMAGRAEASYAGKVLGPAVNIWPEDHDDLPEVVPVEWLYTTCALYRRQLLPAPPFDAFFTGYSIGEDLTLSLRVGKISRLANVRHARIFHDTQPGDHKNDPVALSRMHLVNRHYVMTEILGRCTAGDYARLALWELFQIAASAIQNRGGLEFWRVLHGRVLGVGDLIRSRSVQ
jgi:glycosyltransferase involved in cell wall biosynthesis